MIAKLPNPLKPNSKVGLVCPAGGFVDYKPIDQVIKYLKKRGYRVRVGKSVFSLNKDYKYLSASDYKRLSELLDFWGDETIDAIFCLRGGYGSLRLVKDLDFKLISKTKKILIGFSDITILLLSIYARANLVTFHGPLLGINFLDRNLEPKDNASALNMWRLLEEPQFRFLYSYKAKGVIIYAGKTSGVLLGGNLTSICSMLGSNFLPDFKNSILFLEDYLEEPYKIDRYLTQLGNAGIFEKINGLIFSGFTKCGFKSTKEIINLLKDKISAYKIPAIYNFPIGHGLKNYTVPIGVKVLFDADNLMLKSML